MDFKGKLTNVFSNDLQTEPTSLTLNDQIERTIIDPLPGETRTRVESEQVIEIKMLEPNSIDRSQEDISSSTDIIRSHLLVPRSPERIQNDQDGRELPLSRVMVSGDKVVPTTLTAGPKEVIRSNAKESGRF